MILNRFKLNGKTAVVCGGLGLLGKETSTSLNEAGARVIVLDIKEDKLKNVEFEKFDVTKITKLQDQVKIIFDKYKPDIWVNTAYPRTKDWGNKIEDVKAESWQENVDMQLNSYCILTKEVAELMKKNRIKGSIINFSSIYGVVAPDFSVYPENMTMPAAYSAIKAGIINFSRYVASYYGEYGVRVNSICPGGIFDNQNKEFVANYEKRTPLSRMGTPEDIASGVLFLASDASSYITGESLMIDGGWTCK